jgi:hypothetical protein
LLEDIVEWVPITVLQWKSSKYLGGLITLEDFLKGAGLGIGLASGEEIGVESLELESMMGERGWSGSSITWMDKELGSGSASKVWSKWDAEDADSVTTWFDKWKGKSFS